MSRMNWEIVTLEIKQAKLVSKAENTRDSGISRMAASCFETMRRKRQHDNLTDQEVLEKSVAWATKKYDQQAAKLAEYENTGKGNLTDLLGI